MDKKTDNNTNIVEKAKDVWQQEFVKKEVQDFLKENGYNMDKNEFFVVKPSMNIVGTETWAKTGSDDRKYEVSFVYDVDGRHGVQIDISDNTGIVQDSELYKIRNIRGILKRYSKAYEDILNKQ